MNVDGSPGCSRNSVATPAHWRASGKRLTSEKPFVHLQEISGSTRLRGGPGRTRTSNQTVMSAVTSSEVPIKSDVFRHTNQRMFTISCGQSLAKRWLGNSAAPKPLPWEEWGQHRRNVDALLRLGRRGPVLPVW